MKLDKLRAFNDELLIEERLEEYAPAIYYYYNNQWNPLNPDEPKKTHVLKKLNAQINKTGIIIQDKSIIIYFCESIDCTIALSKKTKLSNETLDWLKNLILKVEKRALNAYSVTYNPMTELLAKNAFKQKLKDTISLLSVKEKNNLNDNQENLQDVDQNQIPIPLLSVLALDIDHFKQINDTYGHIYGDQVLKTFALRLEKTANEILSTSDIDIHLSHPSGEEFWILISGSTSKSQIIEWANIFRSNICNSPLPTDEEWNNLCKVEDLNKIALPMIHERNVSASIGLYFHNDNHVFIDSVTEILENADTALYRAKASGRNRVIPFEDILNNHGRVLEHDVANDIIALDIGKNVGVSTGQEFKVFSPNYTGERSFFINDGRTTRIIGNYPKIELTTITVFDVQPELSFAFINNPSKTNRIEQGSIVEVIPTGSFGHLLTNTSRNMSNLPSQSSLFEVEDLEELIKDETKGRKSFFSIVFRFSSGLDYLKKYGSASLNVALAKLYSELKSNYTNSSRFCIIDSTAICVIGDDNKFSKGSLTNLFTALQDEFSELGMKVGVYLKSELKIDDQVDKKVSPTHAIELSRFAASDYATYDGAGVIYFNHDTANRIVKNQRMENKLSQALSDFQRFIKLGIENSLLFNNAGIINSTQKNYTAAVSFYEKAVENDKKTYVFKLNLCSSLCNIRDYERALSVMAPISDEEIEKNKQQYAFGFVTYTQLLAKAKLLGIPGFNEQRFIKMANHVLSQDNPTRQTAVSEIKKALEECQSK